MHYSAAGPSYSIGRQYIRCAYGAPRFVESAPMTETFRPGCHESTPSRCRVLGANWMSAPGFGVFVFRNTPLLIGS